MILTAILQNVHTEKRGAPTEATEKSPSDSEKGTIPQEIEGTVPFFLYERFADF